jgi:uncharacterized protein YfaT (DUF1175 family)
LNWRRRFPSVALEITRHHRTWLSPRGLCVKYSLSADYSRSSTSLSSHNRCLVNRWRNIEYNFDACIVTIKMVFMLKITR